MNVMFKPMSERKGIKLIKEREVTSIVKWYTKLDNMNIVGPKNPDVLTTKQNQKSLIAMNLINENWCGKIKRRKCAGGSTQRKYIPREDASPSTKSLEALIETLVMDAYEGWYVAIFDAPGAYLNSDIYDENMSDSNQRVNSWI